MGNVRTSSGRIPFWVSILAISCVGARTASTELIRLRTKSFRSSITRIFRMLGCSPGRSASARLASLRYIARRRPVPVGDVAGREPLRPVALETVGGDLVGPRTHLSARLDEDALRAHRPEVRRREDQGDPLGGEHVDHGSTQTGEVVGVDDLGPQPLHVLADVLGDGGSAVLAVDRLDLRHRLRQLDRVHLQPSVVVVAGHDPARIPPWGPLGGEDMDVVAPAQQLQAGVAGHHLGAGVVPRHELVDDDQDAHGTSGPGRRRDCGDSVVGIERPAESRRASRAASCWSDSASPISSHQRSHR